MHLYLRFLFCLLLFAESNPIFGTSIFHSYVTDLSPPYSCKLKLRSARGVSLDKKHSYYFNGICSIKLPIGNAWIYQNVWAEINADWDEETNEGMEVTTFNNNLGTVIVEVKCDGDPWLTKSQCALVGYQNNTNFSNLGGVFNERNGQYPPFEILTGQYPPLARNQAIKEEAIALSLLAAGQEAKAAHAAFNQTFPAQQISPPIKERKIVEKRSIRRKPHTQVFNCPRIDNVRVDYCLRLNSECGKPAADLYCRRMGYKQAVDCKIESLGGRPTFMLGTQTVSNHRDAKGFSEIICGN